MWFDESELEAAAMRFENRVDQEEDSNDELLENVSEKCNHCRIKVDIRPGRCDVGWITYAECADCGREFEIVEYNAEEIE